MRKRKAAVLVLAPEARVRYSTPYISRRIRLYIEDTDDTAAEGDVHPMSITPHASASTRRPAFTAHSIILPLDDNDLLLAFVPCDAYPLSSSYCDSHPGKQLVEHTVRCTVERGGSVAQTLTTRAEGGGCAPARATSTRMGVCIRSTEVRAPVIRPYHTLQNKKTVTIRLFTPNEAQTYRPVSSRLPPKMRLYGLDLDDTTGPEEGPRADSTSMAKTAP
ncbi:hypothetical protein B0H12DRAFT_1244408 [Mycena haematopus]|nr:hypothetical protein B0H12DRAFT_1244408 [Mycena haematopus]